MNSKQELLKRQKELIEIIENEDKNLNCKEEQELSKTEIELIQINNLLNEI